MKVRSLLLSSLAAALWAGPACCGEVKTGPQPVAVASYAVTDADRQFLLELEKRSFSYFVEQAHPVTGLVRDRAKIAGARGSDVASIAATGFGLTALCIGANRGWITEPQARQRVKTTLEFLINKAPQEHGWFYHFSEAATGERVWNSEISSIDTGFLLAGALTAKSCFSGDKEITALADQLYRNVDFAWMLDKGTLLSHGWTPENGFIPNRWDTYSEHLLLSILAIGAPENPAPPQLWKQWRRDTVTYGSFTYVSADAPLFIHQFPQAWLDMRGRSDGGLRPFENSVAATKAHRQFCIDLGAKFSSYTTDVWGITASDGVNGYTIWGGPPATPDIDGTVVPCAAAGSLMFTPELSLATLRRQREKYGDKIWNRYGFADAFNPLTGWTATDVIGIDVGISLLSAENLLSGNVWQWFMQNPEPAAGLKLAGVK